MKKKKAFFLLALMFVMAFLDTLGIASVLPFVAVLSNPELVETNEALIFFYDASSKLGVSNINEFLFILGVTSFLLLMISVIVRSTAHYYQVHFALMREYNISKKLIEGFLHQPYYWFLTRHSADLGKNILSEVNEVVYLSIIPMLNLISRVLVTTTLLTFLIIANPILTLSIGLFLSLTYGLIFYF